LLGKLIFYSRILVKNPMIPLCQQTLNWIPQYKRGYCYNDSTYPSIELENLPPLPEKAASPKSPFELKSKKPMRCGNIQNLPKNECARY